MALRRVQQGLPPLSGAPIVIQTQPRLLVHRGKLHSNRGTSVHAASFLRERRMVLDAELLCNPSELHRILLHELFHFAWWRLGNTRRADWADLLRQEWRVPARGELGWSSQWRKEALAGKTTGPLWKDYVSESFCDTAAFLKRLREHEEHTLARRFRLRRERWFLPILSAESLPV